MLQTIKDSEEKFSLKKENIAPEDSISPTFQMDNTPISKKVLPNGEKDASPVQGESNISNNNILNTSIDSSLKATDGKSYKDNQEPEMTPETNIQFPVNSTGLNKKLNTHSGIMGMDKERIRIIWRRVLHKSLTIAKLNMYSRRFNQIYYGFDDRVYEDNEEKKVRFVILPNSLFQKIWDIIILFFMFYTITLMPYRVAFIDDYDENWNMFETVMQVIFGMDVLVNFMSAYMDKDENIVTSHSKIAIKYLKGWFLIDIVACNLLGVNSDSDLETDNKQTKDINTLVRLMRLPRLYRLLKIFRLFRVFKFFNLQKLSFLRQIQMLTNLDAGFQRLIKIMIASLILVHLSACIFFLIAKLDDFSQTSWVFAENLMDEDPSIQYLYAFYWSMQTVTTVGFGDIPARSNGEKCFAIIWMGVGAAYYSFVISNLQSLVSSQVEGRKLKSKLKILAMFASETVLPEELVHKLKRYFQFSYSEFGYHNITEGDFISELPYTIKAQLMLSLHAKIITRVPFFMGKEISLILRVVPNLKPLNFEPGDIIYKNGDYAEEVFFINYGTVHLKGKNAITFQTYNDGTFFGEIEILDKVYRLGSAQAYSRCLIFGLDKEVFNKMLASFPTVKNEIEESKNKKKLELEQAMATAESVDFMVRYLLKFWRASLNKITSRSTLLFGNKGNPTELVHSSLISKYRLKKERQIKRNIQLIKSKGLGKALKMRSLSLATNKTNNSEGAQIDSISNTASILKMNVTLNLTEEEFNKKVNIRMIQMYQNIMKSIPGLEGDVKKLKEILEKKNQKYLNYLYMIDKVRKYISKVHKRQEQIKDDLLSMRDRPSLLLHIKDNNENK